MRKSRPEAKKPRIKGSETDTKTGQDERYAYSIKELMSNISSQVDKARACRQTLAKKLSEYAKITAECEFNMGTQTLMKFSKMKSELNHLIKELYVTLNKIIESQHLLNKLYYECKAKASRTFSKIIKALNKSEITALKNFLKPEFSDDYDYDSEIERINNQYDSLVKRYLQDLKAQSLSV